MADVDSFCVQESADANICIQNKTPEECSCFEDTTTFVDQYALTLRRDFVETQGFVADTDPNFCEIANYRMCENFWENDSCCCVNEVQTYRKCIFDKIIVPSLPRIQAGIEDCTDTCDYNFLVPAEEEPTGEGVIIGATLGGAVVLIACIIIYCFCLRGKNAKNDNQGGPAGDIEKGGSKTDNEGGVHDNSMSGEDEEEPMLEGKSPEALEKSARSIDDSIREYNQKLERLKKKKEKIHEWRELQYRNRVPTKN